MALAGIFPRPLSFEGPAPAAAAGVVGTIGLWLSGPCIAASFLIPASRQVPLGRFVSSMGPRWMSEGLSSLDLVGDEIFLLGMISVSNIGLSCQVMGLFWSFFRVNMQLQSEFKRDGLHLCGCIFLYIVVCEVIITQPTDPHSFSPLPFFEFFQLVINKREMLA